MRVTPDAGRHIRSGHPWVYDSSIVSVSPEGRAGDLAVVFDSKRRFEAIGLWDPDSPLRIKVLHRGRPRPVDRAFWTARLADALRRRSTLATDPSNTAYRLVHGENDGLPGLVLDRYGTTVVLKLYSAAWLPHLDEVVDALTGLVDADRVILRLSRRLDRADVGLVDGSAVRGDVPSGPVEFNENGLVFDADVVRGQKTGFFLDQRDNRRRVRELSAGAQVLDLFSCTGGFSVNAAAGGAVSVHSVDVSPHAIDATRANFAANRDLTSVAACRHETTTGDAFDEMQRLVAQRRRYDVVVVDPPSFASSQRQVHAALRAYRRLTDLAVRLVSPGGVLVQCSCSSRVSADAFFAGVVSAARDGGVTFEEIERTGHPVDHPVGFAQGEYLKGVFARVGVLR